VSHTWDSRAVRGLAAGLLLAGAAVPSSLGVPPPLPTPPDELACGGAPCLPQARLGVAGLVEDHLAERMSLGDRDRRRLARTIVLEADAAGLDPLLVLAVIEVESSFDPSAESSAGAAGLMQLVPATLRAVAEREGLGEVDPLDPVDNVRVGIRYLKRCLDSYRSSEELGLMAYNAGPNRILSLLRGGEVPLRYYGYPTRVLELRGRLTASAERAAGRPASADAG
jgi:hypothetical protein